MTFRFIDPDRRDEHAHRARHDAAIGAVVIVLLWVIGQAWAGEPAIDHDPAPAVYQHPNN